MFRKKIIKISTFFLIIFTGIFFTVFYSLKENPEDIVVSYVRNINSLNFYEANKIIYNKKINYDDRFSEELEILKSICLDTSVKVLYDKKINENKRVIGVEEEVCDYQGVILFFYKQEFEKGFKDEIDLNRRSIRFKDYINSLKENPEAYRFKKNTEYTVIFKNGSWLIFYE